MLAHAALLVGLLADARRLVARRAHEHDVGAAQRLLLVEDAAGSHLLATGARDGTGLEVALGEIATLDHDAGSGRLHGDDLAALAAVLASDDLDGIAGLEGLL